VERRRIEVGAVRPYERVHLRVQSNTRKDLGIAERSIELTEQYGRKIDGLFGAIGKGDAQRERADTFERLNFVDSVIGHGPIVMATQSVAGQLPHYSVRADPAIDWWLADSPLEAIQW
jgi:hypothetical protein